uniref:Cytochrome P450 n=1 Tax=Rodentolepis nana TaxID=102285 RepID=A0A0R3TEW5_RODNA
LSYLLLKEYEGPVLKAGRIMYPNALFPPDFAIKAIDIVEKSPEDIYHQPKLLVPGRFALESRTKSYYSSAPTSHLISG